MADEVSLDDIALEHAVTYEAMYRALDPEGGDLVQPGAAVTFMKQSKLDNATLGKRRLDSFDEEMILQIWDIADVGAKGHLDKHGCYVALKLISAAQNGQPISVTSLTHDLPAPSIPGFGVSAPGSGRTSVADSVASFSPVPPPAHPSEMNGPPGAPSNPGSVHGGNDATHWTINAADQKKYTDIFNSLEPENGMIGGATVRPVLMNSGLAVDVLGKIWTLSDMNADGNLDLDEFCVAMHLVYACLKGESVPGVLPGDLVPPNKRSRSRQLSGASIHSTGSAAPARPRPPSVGPTSGPPSRPPSRPSSQPPSARRTSLPVGFEVDGDVELDQQMAVNTEDLRKTVSVSNMNDRAPEAPDYITSVGSQPGSRPPSRVSGAEPPSRPAVPPVAPPSGGPSTPVRRLSGAPPPQTVSGSNSPVPVASGPPPPKPPPVVLWPVDVDKHRILFQQVDTDRDGWVNGGDVKNVLIQSGLPTAMLAQIWSLVDIRQTGSLNQQQFALIMHLIEDKRERNVDPPAVLPPNLIPPSLRDIEQASSVTTDAEIAALTADIETLNEEKKGVDEEVMQLQADMKVKQSQIKNLDVEATTLDTTVKQLERQKAEANRRLNDLDLQREALERTLHEMQELLEKDLADVEVIKSEASNMTQSVAEQEAALDQKRMDLQNIREQEKLLRVEFENEQARLDTSNTQYGNIERNIREGEYTVNTLRTQTDQLKSLLSNLEEVLDHNDINELYTRQNQLLYGLQQFSADQSLLDMFNSMSVQSISGAQKTGPVTNGSPTKSVISNASTPTVDTSKPVFSPTSAAASAFPTEDAFTNGHHDSQNDSGKDPFGEAPVGAGATFPVDDPFQDSGEPDPFATAADDPFAETENGADAGSQAKEAPPTEPPAAVPEPTKPASQPEKAESVEAESEAKVTDGSPIKAELGPEDPFGGDAFGAAGGNDPFGSDPNDPFNNGTSAAADSPSKSKPAKPAPPAAASDDPFGAPANGGGDAFANFADFGAFK